MAAIRETFFQECAEQLEALELGLLALEEGEEDGDTVNAIFRAVHSIKGGAGAFDLTDVVRLAHVFETTLDLVRNQKLTPTPELLKLMLRAADILNDLVVSARDGTQGDDASASSVVVELQKVSDEVDGAGDGEDDEIIDFAPIAFDGDFDFGSAEEQASSPTYSIKFRPRKELYSSANDPILVIRELLRLGKATVSLDLEAVPTLDSIDPLQGYFAWTIDLETPASVKELGEVFEFVEDLCDLSIEQVFEAPPQAVVPEAVVVEPELVDHAPEETQRKSSAKASATSGSSKTEDGEGGKSSGGGAPASIRVDLERVDRLINLVGELVINRAMLSQRVEEEGLPSSSALAVGLDDLGQLTREIQDSVMAIRAQPVKTLFQRMSRTVREIAEITGKSVRLKTEGEFTEVDKTVIERLADPLTHMIRNAVDHGVESPEARVAVGKPSEGVVRLSAAHRSGRIIIEVADDGAGIDRARVRETAVRKGIIAADVQMSDGEIENLLFAPGFSTAATVSNISGRGVGMDVVKRSIQALGGRISIASVPGKGTTFVMSLPLTLAVLDGMVVSVHEQTLIVPLTAIVETLKPRPGDVHRVPGADRRLIFSRGEFVPLIEVGKELGFGKGLDEPSDGVAILVEAEGGLRSALLVDEIHDQRQVVIKSLEENYGRVGGIAAATILGNGRVALILDVDAVVARRGSDAAIGESLISDMG